MPSSRHQVEISVLIYHQYIYWFMVRIWYFVLFLFFLSDWAGNVHIHTGKLPSIDMKVEVRNGSKTVTRVVGLDRFSVDMTQFVKDCQKRYIDMCVCV